MSTSERIRSLIDAAKREHQRHQQAQGQKVEREATELGAASRAGSNWLSAHVMPILLELRRNLVEHHIAVEMEENLAPEAHLPSQHFAGPSVSMRLLETSRDSGAAISSARYLFHCDGEYLNISRLGEGGTRPLGMPFNIDSNPHEAEEIVLEIVRRALGDYYRQLER